MFYRSLTLLASIAALSFGTLSLAGSGAPTASDPCEALFLAQDSVGWKPPEDPTLREAYVRFLQQRYGIEPGSVHWGQEYPFIVRGADDSSFHPQVDVEHAIADTGQPGGQYDTIVVGAGPAGLTAGAYLTEAGHRILMLERDDDLGGLGQGEIQKNVGYARGGAYIAEIDGIDYKIYKHLGLGHYKRDLPIPEPIDSYLLNGKLYENIWDPKTLEALPASFELFKYYLKKAGHEKLITSQPMEDAPATFELDKMSFAQWVRTFPAEVAKLAEHDPEAKRISDRLAADPKVNASDPMADVLGLMDLYGRSALGDHADKVSAAAFANFYLSELDTRYTGELGTGTITGIIEKRLKKYKSRATIRTDSPVGQIVDTPDGVDVYYVRDGKTYKAHAGAAVVGAPLGVAMNTIKDFEKIAPDQYNAIKAMHYRHYLVLDVHVKGQPWKRAYDLWVRNDSTYTQNDFTDVIDGRWMEFDGSAKARTDDHGVLTIYQPLPESAVGEPLSDEKVREIAEKSVKRLQDLLAPIATTQGEGPAVKPMIVEVNRWPYSIHLAEPGHFSQVAQLKKPVGHIHFANNNLGVPAVEEGVYRGYAAAREVLDAATGPAASGKPHRRLRDGQVVFGETAPDSTPGAKPATP